MENLNPSAAKLFIATDQEGGLVQRLRGPGFSTIPSGVQQGSIDPATLQADARVWGGQLRQAGVNVNLAPVLDTVPAGSGPNPPIGDLDRQYGSTPAAVTSHGLAFLDGMTAAGIDATVKHFPGLGRTSGNTDLTERRHRHRDDAARPVPRAVPGRGARARPVRDDLDRDLLAHRPGRARRVLAHDRHRHAARRPRLRRVDHQRRRGRGQAGGRPLARSARRSTSSRPAATSCSPSTRTRPAR